MKKQWIPTKEQTIITDNYKYIIGIYDHHTYGKNCLRVTKYKLDGTYIGHFVLVDGDWDVLYDITLLTGMNFDRA